MTAYIRRAAWRWIAISATGAAFAALARVVRRGRRRPSPSLSTDAAAEAALHIARGAMSDEGGPSRSV
jgi:hypothetical protein